MYPDPGPLASENSDQMIRFNLFRFLSGKKYSSIFPEKATENSIQKVNAPSGLRRAQKLKVTSLNFALKRKISWHYGDQAVGGIYFSVSNLKQ